MDFIWILFAFVCGLTARVVSLPPLIGYLIAGFVLNGVGLTGSENLETLSNLGITLMLFTIGLKLNIRSLLEVPVWGSTAAHMSLWIVLITSIAIIPSSLSLSYFAGIEWSTAAIIAFALSFSSTVCIVKILEESGEIKTKHGRLAVGILVVQDIIAVVFMVFATGVLPSVWALSLLLLFFLRKPVGYILDKVGHGELLPLLGFFLAFGGYELFSFLDVKGDLGALIVGMMLSSHQKSTELYKSLMNFKDLFLIGFFLSIGFTALPTWEMLSIAIILTLILPIKVLMFFTLFYFLKLRVRTAFLSSLVLGNYSEFGLIVMALCVQFGWLPKEWLVILALAVSLSFIVTSILYRQAHIIYRYYKDSLNRFEAVTLEARRKVKLPDEAEVLVIGMGRVGKGTYHSLCRLVDNKVWGIDADEERIAQLQKEKLRVVYGDGEDADFWQNMDLKNIRLVLTALPYIQDIKNIKEQLNTSNFNGKIVAIARYEDQIEQLEETGIDRIFNFYTEAGVGFAEESIALLETENKE